MKYALARGLAALETSPSGASDYDRYQQSHSAAINLIDDGKFVCTQRISPDANS
jgi:hypothetical protein